MLRTSLGCLKETSLGEPQNGTLTLFSVDRQVAAFSFLGEAFFFFFFWVMVHRSSHFAFIFVSEAGCPVAWSSLRCQGQTCAFVHPASVSSLLVLKAFGAMLGLWSPEGPIRTFRYGRQTPLLTESPREHSRHTFREQKVALWSWGDRSVCKVLPVQGQGPEFRSPAPFWVTAGGCGGSPEVLVLEKQR